MIDITIAGNPKPQPRHRHVKRGSFVTTYDPAKKEKDDVARQCLAEAPLEPYEDAVKVEFLFAFKRPKSHYGTGANADKLKKSAPRSHTGKPDADNCIKFFQDALNGLYWKDDSVIDEVYARKIWAKEGFTTITITEPDDYV